MIAISLTSIAITRRYILSPLSTLVALATAIADGDVNVSLHAHLALKHPHDEIGILTQAFQRMVIYLSEMATVATRIATGDLRQTIAPLSARDVLGMAFHRMTNYLKRLATAATAIAGGDLQQDIEPEMEHDVLGNAFHTMALQLREGFEKIQEANTNLEQESQRARATCARPWSTRRLPARSCASWRARPLTSSRCWRRWQTMPHGCVTQPMRTSFGSMVMSCG